MLPWFPETLLELSAILPDAHAYERDALHGQAAPPARAARELRRCAPGLARLRRAGAERCSTGSEELREGRRCDSEAPRPRARVRIATTVEYQTDEELERVCELHRRLGIPDDDHVVRPVVRRGRARTNELGIEMGVEDVLPELTLTADGAFLNPFAPTVARANGSRLARQPPDPAARGSAPTVPPPRRRPAGGGDAVRNIR